MTRNHVILDHLKTTVCSEIVLVVVLVASKIVRKANEQAKIKIIESLSDQVFIWQSSLEDDYDD